MASGNSIQVALTGELSADGSLARGAVRFLGTDYVAGQSQVILSGRVSFLDPARGFAVVGKTPVDFTFALADQSMSLEVGALVVVVGTQAQAGQPISAVRVVGYTR
jgi:hypothetical protein